MSPHAGTLRVRRAEANDVGGITACVCAAYLRHVERIGRQPAPMLHDYAEVLRTSDVHVAERDGRIVGVLELMITDEGFLLDSVAVHPQAQGTGVGRALLGWAEEEAKRHGFDAIHLMTNEKMTENQALYARIGYELYDRRVVQGYARVVMRKRLAGPSAAPEATDLRRTSPAAASGVPVRGDAIEVVRPASADDARWLALRTALWPQSPPPEHLADMAQAWSCGDCILLAISNGEALGLAEAARRYDYVNGTTSSPVAFLEGLYVRPERRRAGVARALVDGVMAWARRAHLQELASDAPVDNGVSIAVHRALGFAQTERVVYFRRPVD